MASDPVIGAVLAGGASRRFGAPKTLARFGGEPLLHRPIRAVQEAFGRATVVCKPDTPLPDLPAGVLVWHDEHPDRHPAAGILAALVGAEALGGPRARVGVVAGDMPALGADLLGELASAGDGAVLAVRSGSRQPEPLCGVYPVAWRALLESDLASGEALRASVARLDPVLVEVGPELLWNVNRPEDLAAEAGGR